MGAELGAEGWPVHRQMPEGRHNETLLNGLGALGFPTLHSWLTPQDAITSLLIGSVNC